MVFGVETKKINKKFYLLKDNINLRNTISSEEYVRLRLKKLGFQIRRSKRLKNIGVPDFFYKGDSKTHSFYIEVKTKSDGLRFEQLLWISKNPKEKVYIYYVNQKNPIKTKRKPKKKFKVCYYCHNPKNADEIIKTESKKNICKECSKQGRDKSLK